MTSEIPREPEVDKNGVQIRKNFNETAFFFPDLKTDSNGAIEFSFTITRRIDQMEIPGTGPYKRRSIRL